jgi:hypothetical protein
VLSSRSIRPRRLLAYLHDKREASPDRSVRSTLVRATDGSTTSPGR